MPLPSSSTVVLSASTSAPGKQQTLGPHARHLLIEATGVHELAARNAPPSCSRTSPTRWPTAPVCCWPALSACCSTVACAPASAPA
jgi:hypothetical protein